MWYANYVQAQLLMDDRLREARGARRARLARRASGAAPRTARRVLRRPGAGSAR